MSKIKNGRLGLYGAEHSNCNHLMTLGSEKLIYRTYTNTTAASDCQTPSNSGDQREEAINGYGGKDASVLYTVYQVLTQLPIVAIIVLSATNMNHQRTDVTSQTRPEVTSPRAA